MQAKGRDQVREIIATPPWVTRAPTPSTSPVTRGGEIWFVRPSCTLAVSLTGGDCALQCAHCGGRYLQGMVPVKQACPDGYTSCLISGGCDPRGRVSVGPWLGKLAALHSGRRFNWHVGLSSEQDIQPLLPYLDVISFDVVGDDKTIKEVYGLDVTVSDYQRTYAMLRRYGRVVPHLTLGLYGGEWRGERHTLEWLTDVGLDTLVLLVMIPTPGTRYAGCQPPSVTSVVTFIEQAKATLGPVPIYLGCMRPGGRYRRELDPLAVTAGVTKLVNPTKAAVEMALAQGRSVRWESECCAMQ